MSRDDGPPLLRPIPRRPFDLAISSPTFADDESPPARSPNPNDIYHSRLRGLLDPQNTHNASSSSLSEAGDSLSRAQSILNMTGSTLFGIYSPTVANGSVFNDSMEPNTPWGTGAETPAPGSSLDDRSRELIKERSQPPLRRKSTQQSIHHAPPQSNAMRIVSLTLRAALLFTMGMGYGMLVSRLQGQHQISAYTLDGVINPGCDRRCLVFWGVCGVALGGLLPWFDTLWDQNFGKEDRADAEDLDGSPETDWALVIRGIGAFAGIVFAIRRLPWASTMQVSMTLALVNPFLWYLIDRSKSGFLLSTAVGMTGTAILMGLDPAMVPTPAHLGAPYQNTSSSSLKNHPSSSSSSSLPPSERGNLPPPRSQQDALGGLASLETVETTMWVLSVLFCSCVCFGNIGRRLALSKSASARGRWGGVR